MSAVLALCTAAHASRGGAEVRFAEVRNVGLCRFEIDDDRSAVADALSETCSERAVRIFEELGAIGRGRKAAAPVTIRIVGDPAKMGAVSPAGARPPDWSIAVAYPEVRLIVLALRHRDGRPVEDLEIELEHELSHIALRDVVRGADVPRWLSEGIAVIQSERSSMLRRSALLLASIGGGVRSIAALHDYPRGDDAVALAYSEAADFVGFLVRGGGWRGIRVTLRRLARGVPIDEALDAAYGRDLSALEKEWRRELARRPTWIAIVTGSSAIWGAAAMLFVVAYVRAKKRKTRRLAEMEEEEKKVIA
jgi:hypothetical protein